MPIARFDEVPSSPDQPPMPPEMLQLVMHVELPILGGHALMGTDAPEGMGIKPLAENFSESEYFVGLCKLKHLASKA